MRCRDGRLRLLVSFPAADRKEAWDVFGILLASEFQDIYNPGQEAAHGDPWRGGPKAHSERPAGGAHAQFGFSFYWCSAYRDPS